MKIDLFVYLLLSTCMLRGSNSEVSSSTQINLRNKQNYDISPSNEKDNQNPKSISKPTEVTSSSSSYPQSSLQCYATLAPPSKNNEKRVICPESRSNYCIKEVAQISRRSDCGTSKEYPWDEWDIKLGQCVYRKCSATCPFEYPNKTDMHLHSHQTEDIHESHGDQKEPYNTTTKFFLGEDGTQFKRETFCCSDSLCNSARSVLPSLSFTSFSIPYWSAIIACVFLFM